MGTGTAVVAAYVLAGELARSRGDHTTAFRRYEHLLRDYATRCQSGGDRTGRFLAPTTRLGMATRNALLRRQVFLRAMLRVGEKVSSAVALPDYEGLVGS
ncbi:hypothetical protein ACFV3R_03510 [Streptomyces sp. NPDC059740]|uniref:hypothetical protein n=1 Tax=Streptomyces sp. NPDC059740 TaxID=3346926 RepID=UPI0036562247